MLFITVEVQELVHGKVLDSDRIVAKCIQSSAFLPEIKGFK